MAPRALGRLFSRLLGGATHDQPGLEQRLAAVLAAAAGALHQHALLDRAARLQGAEQRFPLERRAIRTAQAQAGPADPHDEIRAAVEHRFERGGLGIVAVAQADVAWPQGGPGPALRAM